MSEKPDHIVWDEETQKYHANILPYGSSVSAPAIQLDDVGAFKERGVHKAQKPFLQNTKNWLMNTII